MLIPPWIVAALAWQLPADYTLVDSTSERIAHHLGPPGRFSTQEFRSWQAPADKHLYLFYWQPTPPRDLGPMHAVAEWPATIAGQAVKVIETDMFMGRQQRVLVAHLRLEQANARVMLYAKGLDRAEFAALLAGITLRPH